MKDLTILAVTIFALYVQLGSSSPDAEEIYAASLDDAPVGLYGKSSSSNRPYRSGYRSLRPRPNYRRMDYPLQGQVLPQLRPSYSRPRPSYVEPIRNGYEVKQYPRNPYRPPIFDRYGRVPQRPIQATAQAQSYAGASVVAQSPAGSASSISRSYALGEKVESQSSSIQGRRLSPNAWSF